VTIFVVLGVPKEHEWLVPKYAVQGNIPLLPSGFKDYGPAVAGQENAFRGGARDQLCHENLL
jgi:hypothetical protein